MGAMGMVPSYMLWRAGERAIRAAQMAAEPSFLLLRCVVSSASSVSSPHHGQRRGTAPRTFVKRLSLLELSNCVVQAAWKLIGQSGVLLTTRPSPR